MEEKLKEIWIGHGFVGAEKLYQIAKAKGLAVKASQVKEFLKGQEVAQLHKQPVKAAEVPITVDGAKNEYQMDLLDESAFANKNRGYRWILIVEDLWSRKAAAIPSKTKSPNDIVHALQQGIAQLGGKPVQIVSDSGTEWQGAVKTYLNEIGVNHRTVEVGSHTTLGVIDRLAKTVKNALHKKFTHSQDTNWIDYLSTLMKNYNDSPNAALKAPGEPALTPNEGEKFETDVRNIHEAKVHKAEDKAKPSELELGSHVRVLKRKGTFDRGYEVRYSKDVFTIVKIDGQWFELSNGKRYREGSLQKIKAPATKTVEEPLKDVAREAKFEHKTEQILRHKEGVEQTNRRAGLRERKPTEQVEDVRFGKIKW